LGAVAAVMVLASVGLAVRLTVVQVVDGVRYAAYEKGEVDQKVVLGATRGAIYDSTGDVLAVSVPRTDVVADDFQITKPVAEARTLAPLLRVPVARLAGELGERNGYVVLARGLTNAEVAPIERRDLAGLSFAADSVRVMTGSDVFQPLIGGVDAAGVGDAGIEQADNALLAGKAGSELVALAPGGYTLPGGPTHLTAAKAGTGLVLTIDEPLQVEVEKDLAAQVVSSGAHSGIAVVMDVHSGAILAMVDLIAGPHGSIGPAASNLAATTVYQPGSVMKLATVMAALQAGLITPSTVLTVPDSIGVGGYRFADAEVHPTEQLSVAQILAQSSNIGTIEIAQRLGLTRLAAGLSALGFGRPTGLDWPGESAGIVGSPATWFGSAAAAVPIGTGIAVTPLQVLDAYNTIANGGVFVTPRLVAGTVNGDAREHLLSTRSGVRAVAARTVGELVPMLEGVVQDGTAVLANIPGYTAAGKTGTAQVPETTGPGYVPGDWNATFVGFVPAQDPELSGIVVLNHPAPIYGGLVSAPVFSQIMRYALRRFDIPPSSSAALAASVSPASKR
jgi:cell division protein FtsI/penicillin-binding protein 2